MGFGMDGQYVEEQWEKVFLFGAFNKRNKKRNQAANIFFICGQAYSVGGDWRGSDVWPGLRAADAGV